MNTEVLNIVDTAVKIGLGALISGFATYYVTKLNHSKEVEKELRTRKLNILESASENINEYFNAFSRFISAIDGVQRRHPNTNKIIDIKNGVELQLVSENDEAFCDARDHKEIAISRLRVIGIKSAADILNNLEEIEKTARLTVMFKKEIPKQDTLESWRSELKRVKKEFFQEIGRAYTG